jgi:hypothetical protein
MEEATQPTEPEVKVIKVVDPTWVGYLAEPIRQFVDKINIPTIRYETLYTYLVNVVQFGGNASELWVAHNEGNYSPIAWAVWYIKGPPHVGAAEIGYIHSWNRARVPVGLLVDKFLEFAYNARCKVYTGEVVNEAVYKVVERLCKERGVALTKTGLINFYGTRA